MLGPAVIGARPPAENPPAEKPPAEVGTRGLLGPELSLILLMSRKSGRRESRGSTGELKPLAKYTSAHINDKKDIYLTPCSII